MKDEPLLVDGCPLCDLFKGEKLPSGVIHLSMRFMIIKDYKFSKYPIVVFKNHTTTIGKEDWGHILQVSRKLFGMGVRLHIRKYSKNLPRDHWYAIIESDKYES